MKLCQLIVAATSVRYDSWRGRATNCLDRMMRGKGTDCGMSLVWKRIDLDQNHDTAFYEGKEFGETNCKRKVGGFVAAEKAGNCEIAKLHE